MTTTQEMLKRVEQYNQMIDGFTEYEERVLEDIIEYGQSLGMSRGECLDSIERLTQHYWTEILN